jgi:glycosyltransferase involved in cell wall biosynthesis
MSAVDGGAPLFSFVVPSYNRVRLIGRTLESLLAQTEPSFELIVVDDGSTDDTEAVVRGFTDARLRYFRKDNGERGAARNFGTAKARGEYLNFFDSDDLAYPHHLTEARALIHAQRRPPAFHLRYDVRTPDGRLLSVGPRVAAGGRRQIASETLLRGNALSCNGVFVRRDVAQALPFVEERALAGTEDWVLWLRIAARHPLFENDVPTSSIIQHDTRSVVVANLRGLCERTRLARHWLAQDPEFVRRFGTRGLAQVEAHMHTYTALHAAMGGSGLAPVIGHLAQAARAYPRELMRRRTLATLKHLVRAQLGSAMASK